MKNFKKILVILLLIVLGMPFFVKADGWDENGGAGEVGSGAKNPCDDYNDFCLYNAKNGSKGVRVSLAYCTASGCTPVTNLQVGGQNKSIKKIDYWYKIVSGNYRYYGMTKSDSSLRNIQKNNYNYNYTSNYSNNYRIDSSFFLLNATSDNFFGDLEQIFQNENRKEESIIKILKDLGNITSNDLKAASIAKCSSCDFSNEGKEGFRILLEPIFWWKTDKSQTNWLLTPSEVASLTASRSNMAGNTDYRLYTSAVSLHTTRDDVFYKNWNGNDSLSSSSFGSSNTTFRSNLKSTSPSYGIALNIINPLYNFKALTCEMVNFANPGLKDTACPNILGNALNGIKVNGQQVDKIWYYNECTCCGFYDQFDKYLNTYINNKDTQSTIVGLNKALGSTNWFQKISLSDVKTNRLGNIFSSQIFYNYNAEQEKRSSSLNPAANWTPVSYEKYEKLGCAGKQQENYWCNEFNTWYKNTINKLGLGYKNITSMTKEEITGPKYWEVTSMMQAYNTVFNVANGFYWSVNTNDVKGPMFSYVDSCMDGGTPTPGLSCSNINNFYASRGQVLTDRSCSYIGSFNFSAYNVANNQKVTGVWYQNNCGCKNITVTNCTPKYNIGICTNGDTTYYKDSSDGNITDKYWNDCVFNDNGSYDITNHKTSANGTNTYYDSSLSNKYCPVYCIEELATNFDRSVSVKAGGNFSWSGHQVSGSRTCKTKSIDYTTFEKDVEASNKDIAQKYADWQLEIKKSNSIMTRSTVKSSSNCSCIYNTSHNSCCSNETPKYHSRSCTVYCSVPSCKTVNGKLSCSTKRVACGKKDCSYYTYPCTSPNNTRYDLYTAKKVDFKEGTTGISLQWGPVSWCSNQSAPSTYVNSKKNLYDSALATGNSIITTMQSCYKETDWKNKIFNLDPTLNVKYSSPKYNYEGKLNGSVSNGSVQKKASCVSTTIGAIKGCSGTSCPITNVAMDKCTSVEMSKTANATYNIPNDVYRYIIKDTNESLMTNDFQTLLNSYNSSKKVLNYIDLGRGNFPVAYATPDGKYGVNSSDGELSITYTGLGHKSGSNRTMVDNILSTISPANYTKWLCNYYVNSELIDEKDVTVIFRPIDLSNPFPNKNGVGRDTGRNWCGSDGCSSKNSLVQKVINNNRGVKEDAIYQKKPMYTFVLTPAIITKIRQYNDENVYDQYTGHLGTTATYNFVCDKGTGRRCVSEYLTDLIQLTGSTGTCVSDRKNSFDSCRND